VAFTKVVGLVVIIVDTVVPAGSAASTRAFFPDQDPGGASTQKAHETRLGFFENLDFHFVPAGPHLKQGL
jgi:hypothetical protein